MHCNVIKVIKQKSLEFLLESWDAAAGDVRGTSKALLSADHRFECLVMTGDCIAAWQCN